MGRHTCCFKQKLRKGLWSPEEDEKLLQHITKYGHGCWSSVPKLAGLQRCGKSCRLRWINYLRPDLKRGAFSEQEENLIIQLHAELGNRWSQIAAQLPGRTDNEIKNLWNSSIKKKLREKGIDPNTHRPLPEAGGEKSGTPCSSPDHAPSSSGPRNPSAGYFAVNFGPDSRTPPEGLTAEAGANSIFWFGQSSKAYDASTGFDCGSISSVLPPVSSSMLSTSTGIRPMTSLLQEASSSACGGGINGVHYWESGTSSNNSGTTGNSSIELQTGANFIHNPVFPWREYAANREPEHLPLEGELDELKWSDFLQSATMPSFPSPLAIHQSNGQNQLVLDEFGNWQQMHRPPPPPPPFPLAQLQQDHQQQSPLLPVQNQDMYSKDLQRISAAFGQL